jgi:hypothetical protein
LKEVLADLDPDALLQEELHFAGVVLLGVVGIWVIVTTLASFQNLFLLNYCSFLNNFFFPVEYSSEQFFLHNS